MERFSASAFRIARFSSVWPCPEGHSANFVVIQTHLSRRFYLAVDFLGLRRSGSWLQTVNKEQDFPEQFLLHGNLGPLERDVPAMADNLRTDHDQLLPQCGERPVLDFLRQR